MVKYKFDPSTDPRVIEWSMNRDIVDVAGPLDRLPVYRASGQYTFKICAIDLLGFERGDTVVIRIPPVDYECEVKDVIDGFVTPTYLLSHFDERAHAEAQAELKKRNSIIAMG